MSNGNLISRLRQTLSNDKWLEQLCGQEKATQQSELKKLFAQVQDNDLDANDKAFLTQNQEKIKAQLDKLDNEMKELRGQIAEKQDEISSVSTKISNLLVQIDGDSKNVEESQRKHANNVVADVFAMKQRNPEMGADKMVSEMFNRMQKFSENSGYKSLMKKIDSLDGLKSKAADLVSQAEPLLSEKTSLERNYGATKSAYDLISKNVELMTNASSFTNTDSNINAPVYSATKLETISSYFENSEINVQADENSKYKEGTTAPNPTLESINEKYKDYLKTEATGDVWTIGNKAVENLGKAIEEGLLMDLKMAGISGTKLEDFLAKNFAGANIKKSDDGVLKIPYGHGKEARAIFSKLTDFLKVQTLGDDPSKWSGDYFLGVENTWDKDKGNTLGTNKQIESLSKNFNEIATAMKNKGFTFKEAMYAMFNPENGLFKDSGIIYDLSKQADGAKYFMEYAGDSETAEVYKNVASTIFKNWGVKPTACIDYDNIGKEAAQGGEEIPIDVIKRTDPLTFVQGDKEYAFVFDRDGNSKFDSPAEFLGGNEGSSWLDDLRSLDTDGNGVLEGDELDQLKLLQSDIKDNDKTKETGGFITEETTNIDHKFISAKNLGIEKIDLNGLEENVNKTTGRTDVNGSEVFEDSFTFTLNGRSVTAKRKDDTQAYMNTVYGGAMGVGTTLGSTEEEVQKVLDGNYSTAEEFGSEFTNFEEDVNNLQNLEDSVEEAKGFISNIETESDSEYDTIIKKGQLKAEAQYGKIVKDWADIEREVLAVADEKGIDQSLRVDLTEQAKGMFITNSELSAREMVDKYLEMQDIVKSGKARREHSQVALKALVACAGEGISAKMDDILKLLTEGKASNIDEIVEYYKAQNQEPEGNNG